jgi:stearoyl-CoA desaturase (delta-9 desaturase)
MEERTMTDLSQGNHAYRVHSLTGLDRADPIDGHIVWDRPRSIWNMSMLAGALVVGPLTFSAETLVVFLATSLVTLCAGHSVGFHRRLIHRSFDCPKWLERVLVYFGTLVGMGGPFWTIRLHDTRDWAQRQQNCHWFQRHGKPLLLEGFYYLNFKLVLDRPPGFDPGPGISDDGFYRFLQRTWMLQQLPLALLLFFAGGWPWVVWGVVVRVAASVTMHWYISHRAHTSGPDDWAVDGAVIQANNVPWMAIPTMGEAWHGNHHAFPSSARHGLYPGQLDLGWQFVRLLQAVGLAFDVKVPETLPPRPGIVPLSARAIAGATPAQLAAWRNASSAAGSNPS